MITAVLDTNIFVQSAIGSSRGASHRTLKALDEGKFRLVLSPAVLDELLEVLSLPKIRARHGWSDDEILMFITSLVPDALIYVNMVSVPANIPRDVTDTKFLALAYQSKANYLVTNDRRHLLRLKQFGRTRIVSPARFLRELR
jgi:putative PIN family toxin of toxin-antitoxin system